MKNNLKWEEKDDALLVRMRANGSTYKHIAMALGRTESAISNRVYVLDLAKNKSYRRSAKKVIKELPKDDVSKPSVKPNKPSDNNWKDMLLGASLAANVLFIYATII